MGKFDKIIYTIPPEYHNWDGYASPRAGFRGNMVPGVERARANFGFSVSTKEGYMEIPHMHHAIDEYLVFTGADLVNFFESFDAEIEVWLGEDPLNMEKITITKPTIIRVPPNMWHCPINFKRLGKPVCFIPLYMDGDWSKVELRMTPDGREEYIYAGGGLRRCVKDRSKACTYCGSCFSEAAAEMAEEGSTDDFLKPYYEMEKNNVRTGKYDKLVYTIEPEYHQWGDTFTNPRGGYPGVKVDPEARVYFGYDIMLKPGPMDDPHMHHAVEEYLVFTGADLMDPFASFDAEISIMLGEDPDHMEEYTFTEPTIFRIPPNFWHCPINFKRIGKPVNFMPIYLDGCWTKIGREFIKDDKTPTYVFEGVGASRCRYDSEKLCVYCGKCFAEAKKAQEEAR